MSFDKRDCSPGRKYAFGGEQEGERGQQFVEGSKRDRRLIRLEFRGTGLVLAVIALVAVPVVLQALVFHSYMTHFN